MDTPFLLLAVNVHCHMQTVFDQDVFKPRIGFRADGDAPGQPIQHRRQLLGVIDGNLVAGHRLSQPVVARHRSEMVEEHDNQDKIENVNYPELESLLSG